jgi:chromosome segregation ATPase
MTRISMIVLMGCLFSVPAWAKDVATEQYNATQARQRYLDSRDQYETLTAKVEAQAQRVAQEQARLDEVRKGQQAAKVRMDEAQARMKERQEALQKAWNNRK